MSWSSPSETSTSGGALLFLLMNRAHRDRDSTPKTAYADLL
jgi:hypothetical protein